MNNDNETKVNAPDEDLDASSKVSIWTHIYYRMNLAFSENEIPHQENGQIKIDDLKKFTMKVIEYSNPAISLNNEDEVDGFLEELEKKLWYDYQGEGEREGITGDGDDVYESYEFLKKYSFGRFSKFDLAELIAQQIGFPFDPVMDMGKGNGVISINYLKKFVDHLPEPGEELKPITEENKDEWDEVNRPKIDVVRAEDLADLFRESNTKSDYSDMDQKQVPIIVPPFQRANSQWTYPKQLDLVDSLLRDIPMPSIVLARVKRFVENPETGKEEEIQEAWKLIDGQQRLTNYLRFVDDTMEGNFTLKDKSKFSDLPKWAQDRINNYKFNVERVTVNEESELAELYVRYNDSGVKMSPVQLRIAQYHETSALHHYLLAMAGGPVLNRSPADQKIGVKGDINSISKHAKEIRKILPFKHEHFSEAERTLVKKVTENCYDFISKITAYSTYRNIPKKSDAKIGFRPDKDKPSAKEAIKIALEYYERSNDASVSPNRDASKISKRLFRTIKNTNSIFGEWAFVGLKLKKVDEAKDWDKLSAEELEKAKLNLDIWSPGSKKGWFSQIQCASLWSLPSESIELLNNNLDEVRKLWLEFAVRINMLRQNSDTIWEQQDRWNNELTKFLFEKGSSFLTDEKKDELDELVTAVLELPKKHRHVMTRTWETMQAHEQNYLELELEKREDE